MSDKPNFELLKEAYAIIGGIPAKQFDLSDVISERGPSLKCNTIACAAGWLALHPKMQEAADIHVEGHGIRSNLTGNFIAYDIAMARLFNINPRVCDELFAPRGNGSLGEDAEDDFKGTDKQLWQKRIRAYLRQHGQLKSQLARKAAA